MALLKFWPHAGPGVLRGAAARQTAKAAPAGVRASILAQIAPFHAQLLLKETPSAEEAAKTLMAMPVAPRMSLLSAMDLPSKQRCLRGLAEVEEAAWVGGNATMSPGMRVTDSGWLPARKEACKQEEDPCCGEACNAYSNEGTRGYYRNLYRDGPSQIHSDWSTLLLKKKQKKRKEKEVASAHRPADSLLPRPSRSRGAAAGLSCVEGQLLASLEAPALLGTMR